MARNEGTETEKISRKDAKAQRYNPERSLIEPRSGEIFVASRVSLRALGMRLKSPFCAVSRKNRVATPIGLVRPCRIAP